MHSGSPQVYHRLRKIHGHGSYSLHHAWTRNNRCNDSAPAPSPARNVLPSASFSMLYFLSLLGLHASRDIHEYSRSLFSVFMPLKIRLYPFFGFRINGLGNALANHPGEELMQSKSPTTHQSAQPPYASAKGY